MQARGRRKTWLGALLVLPLLLSPAGARVLEVGPGRAYSQPSEAAAAARAGDRVVIAPGEYRDCAVWRQSNLIIEGAGGGSTVLAGQICQDRGIFVVAGNDVTIRNLTLARARASAANGAGIFLIGRNLTIEGMRFLDNENGILTAPQPQGALVVRDSDFLRNGSCVQECAHGIYAGRIALLRVERSRFRGTRVGHHVKSRAARTEVLDSEIADGPDGTASYLIDVPSGGEVLIRGNRLQKGPRSENAGTAIALGFEGEERPSPRITVEGNRFEMLGDRGTIFVNNRTQAPALLRGNRLSGRVQPLQGPGSVER